MRVTILILISCLLTSCVAIREKAEPVHIVIRDIKTLRDYDMFDNQPNKTATVDINCVENGDFSASKTAKNKELKTWFDKTCLQAEKQTCDKYSLEYKF